MSKSMDAYYHKAMQDYDEQFRQEGLAQASDLFTLQRAKEILAELWKDSRIDMYVRSEGEVALSAALYAIENPGCPKVTKRQGAWALGEQWEREQERKNREF